MSIQADVAFEGQFHRKPTEADALWLAGYEQARTDNGGVLSLMEKELRAWRDGQLQSKTHRDEARKLKLRIEELEAAATEEEQSGVSDKGSGN